MKIRLKCFGRLAEITGKSELEVSEIADTDLLLEKMRRDFPGLNGCSFLISVNMKLVKSNQQLKQGDEVALLPPFAGG